tara:strand:- start:883 stop:1209 length:327 start_codon:yes stop_codon:yes gene_type:complete
MEKLFLLGKELGEAVSSIQEALKDSKITFSEGFDVSKELSSLGFFVIKNRSELSAIANGGIDLEEQEEFIDGFKEGYELSDGELESDVEHIVEDVIDAVNDIIRVFVR